MSRTAVCIQPTHSNAHPVVRMRRHSCRVLPWIRHGHPSHLLCQSCLDWMDRMSVCRYVLGVQDHTVSFDDALLPVTATPSSPLLHEPLQGGSECSSSSLGRVWEEVLKRGQSGWQIVLLCHCAGASCRAWGVVPARVGCLGLRCP